MVAPRCAGLELQGALALVVVCIDQARQYTCRVFVRYYSLRNKVGVMPVQFSVWVLQQWKQASIAVAQMLNAASLK